jgi:hypothetical protein
MSVFTDDNLRSVNNAMVQLIKSRFGSPIADPFPVYVDPRYALFGDQGSSMGATNQDFAALFDDVYGW